MATPSPLNFNQRGKAASPRGFTTAEDYASHHAALNSGPTGMHEKNTIQSGPHKGKTPDQVYAHYLDAGMALGIPRRSVDGSTNGRLLLGQAPGQAASPSARAVAPVSPKAQAPVGPVSAAPPSTAQAAPMAATPRPTSRPKSFEGQSALQFGAEASSRQGRGNAFTGYKVISTADPFQTAKAVSPTSPAGTPMGPAQKALADFTAANPNVKTQAEIDQMQQTFQDNRDKLTTIQAQKQVANHAAQSNAMRAKEAAAPPMTDAENLAEQIRPGILNENRARAAGPPRAVSPGSPPLANATGQTGNILSKITQPKPSLAPLLAPPSQPLIAGARADGGPVQGGKPYLVGERGPEIVVPAQNGTVIPNKAISPSRLGRDKAMAYPPAGYPNQGLAPAAGQVRRPIPTTRDWRTPPRPVKAAGATSNDWRSPTRPVKAARPSLVASH